jgi:quinol monooxygenase YgiN
MATISTSNDVVTLVNIFTVAPERQQELIDLLTAATEEVMRTLPGYISANIHRSLDGTRVVNYAQWRSRADFEAMLKNPAAGKHMAAVAKLATFEPTLCTVVYTDEANS